LTGIEAAAARGAALGSGCDDAASGNWTGIEAAACKAVALGSAGAGAAVACTGLDGGKGAAFIGDGVKLAAGLEGGKGAC
jgi:hypothetical protein